MKGFPNFLNTKEDYENVRKNFPKNQWLPNFQALLNSKKDWFFVKELEDGEIGLSDDTHKIEIQLDQEVEGGKHRRYQFELRENPNCLMNTLGYTEQEVLAIINEQ